MLNFFSCGGGNIAAVGKTGCDQHLASNVRRGINECERKLMHYKIFLVRGKIGRMVWVRQVEAISSSMKPGWVLEPTSRRVLGQTRGWPPDVKFITKNEIFKVGGLDLA